MRIVIPRKRISLQAPLTIFSNNYLFESVPLELLPHNETTRKVRKILEDDFDVANQISIVTGYASLDELLTAIHRKKPEQTMRILIGNEPSVGPLTKIKNTKNHLSQEIKKYWLEERQISLTHSFVLLNAYRRIENEDIEIRINSANKPLHAKICGTDFTVITGSSNFTRPGLSTQREFNVRFSKTEDISRYTGTFSFIEGCFKQSEDYKSELLDLLDKLIRKTSWQEALACACWDMLDGLDSDKFLKQFNLDQTNLWPHQKKAIAQGLSILREQGSVLVADSTGSGKTRTGLWLMAAADTMIKNSQENSPLNPDPILVVPSSVQKEWRREVRRELRRTPDVIGHGQISHNYKENTEGAEILDRLTDTTVVLVDEAHNFYNDKSNRTMKLRAHGAQSSVLLTATPINRSFDDLLSLIELLSQDEFDEDLELKLKNLRKKVYSKNKDERRHARLSAASLVQDFTVRRTRFDLNRIAALNPNEYIQPGRINPGFPNREKTDYQIESCKEDETLLSLITNVTSKLRGLAYLPKEIQRSLVQKENGVKEVTIVNQTIALAKAASKYRIWSTLASSRSACYEHVTGTESAMKVYNLNNFKVSKSMIPTKLESQSLPKWKLSEDLKNEPTIPDWLIDKEQFEKELHLEKERYKAIGVILLKMSNSMENSRAKLLYEHYQNGSKVLAFDWHLISLNRMKDLLCNMGVPEDRIFLFDSKNKAEAEVHFSLKSDELPSIGLCSDSLNEGINLQGANTMINLDRPTTVRRYEQRMGRVDRMNSRYDDIVVKTPILPDIIQSHLTDHLTERLQLVREIFGGNDIDKETGLSEYDEAYTGQGDSQFEIEDAFSPIRNLIGDNGILSDSEYQQFGVPDARARAEISILKSEHPWCFFAIRSSHNSSLKWALLTYKNTKPNLSTGLKDICDFLSSNLNEELDVPEDELRADKYVKMYFDELESQRNSLLPKRHRNSLKLGVSHIAELKSDLFKQDRELHDRFKQIQIQFGAPTEVEDQEYNLENTVNKFALAEAWTSRTKQIQRQSLRFADGRSTTKTRKALFLQKLKEKPISIEDAEELIQSIPLQRPISEEVTIVIAGIPGKRLS